MGSGIRFLWEFQVNHTWLFALFSGLFDCGIVLILVWFKRSPYPAQVSWLSCPWPLKLMMSQTVEGTWIRTGGYGRFRGEAVKGMCWLAMSGRHMWYKQYFSKKFKVSCLKQGSDINDLFPRNWANDFPKRRPTLHQLKQCILGRNHIASTSFTAIVILCHSPYITLELGLGRVELVHFGFKASFLSETKFKQDNFIFAKWRLNDRFSVLLITGCIFC